jgi:DNA-binding NarL/FixJ family response regulator
VKRLESPAAPRQDGVSDILWFPSLSLNMDVVIMADLIPSTIQPQQWMVIALAGVTIIYAVFIRPMMKQKKDPLARPPQQTRLSQHRAVERQMENLLVELSEMARQITAQLDTRAVKLDLLIKEADEKLAALKLATDGLAQLASFNAQNLPGLGNSAGARPIPIPLPQEPADPRHTAIYQLADNGRSVREIAQQLGHPSGEVELILALRPHG